MVEQIKNGIEELTQFAMEVVRRSGEEALSYYGKGMPAVKFDEGLVTEAELRLSEFFQDQLAKHFPEHRVFNNNQSRRDYTHEGDGSLWVYDPLEGVANDPYLGRFSCPPRKLLARFRGVLHACHGRSVSCLCGAKRFPGEGDHPGILSGQYRRRESSFHLLPISQSFSINVSRQNPLSGMHDRSPLLCRHGTGRGGCDRQ